MTQIFRSEDAEQPASKLDVVRAAIAECGVSSCLWMHAHSPSRIRMVVKTDEDVFEAEIPIKLSFKAERIREALVAGIAAARAQRARGAAFDGPVKQQARDTETFEMFEKVG
jgi:hypothetical protein